MSGFVVHSKAWVRGCFRGVQRACVEPEVVGLS